MNGKLFIGLVLAFCLACGSSTAHFGEPCGEEIDCSYRLTCSEEKICEPCGGDGELCCDDNLQETGGCSSGECKTDGRCQACGLENQPCCSDGSCSLKSTCSAENICVACGQNNQPCCDGKCNEIACGSDGVCHSDICDEGGNCQQCGLLDTSCCIGNTCKANLACNEETVCSNCGALDELACSNEQCDGWFAAFDGYCRIPFAENPEADVSICVGADEKDIRKREHASWCYWYAAYYKHDNQLCRSISNNEMKELCSEGENPDDYFVIITSKPKE